MHDLFDLSGNVALVTGGARGLGFGMVEALAASGARVVVASRNVQQVEEAVTRVRQQGGLAEVASIDLLEEGAPAALVTNCVDRFGRVDTLVHAAGNQHRAPVLEFPDDAFDAVLHVHLRAAYQLAQATGRHLLDRGSEGSLVLIGSLASEAAGIRNVMAYAAAKSGLLGLMRTLAVELGEHGIRTNAIAPGFFATEMTADVAGDPYRESLYARIPMGRMGSPSDLAGTAVYLASPASRYVNGQCIAVDGGWSVA